MERKTAQSPAKHYEERVIRRYRNYRFMLFLCFGAIGLLFLVLSFSYFVNKRMFPQAPLYLHPVFMVNTALLLFSSITLEFARLYFRRDQWRNYRYAQVVFFSLALLFLTGQVAGWFILSRIGFGLEHHAAAYLFLISGFHALHLVGGLVFYLYFVVSAWKFLGDYATALVYFTDPVARRQLGLFAMYWHFLGGIWMYLLLFFLIVR